MSWAWWYDRLSMMSWVRWEGQPASTPSIEIMPIVIMGMTTKTKLQKGWKVLVKVLMSEKSLLGEIVCTSIALMLEAWDLMWAPSLILSVVEHLMERTNSSLKKFRRLIIPLILDQLEKKTTSRLWELKDKRCLTHKHWSSLRICFCIKNSSTQSWSISSQICCTSISKGTLKKW